ncbi:MAG: hypothetical protein WAU60_03075 [Candidatus Competibacter denitrificans]|jgi:Cu/Ag efflux protein CusF
MKRIILAAGAVLGLLLVGGCATTPDEAKTAKVNPAATQLEIRDQITATAIVQSVDVENRQVTLKGKGGKLHTISVSDGVRNLPQIKSGDRVELTYHEALAVSLDKPGVTPDRAETGQKSAMARQDTEIVANVTAVNQKRHKVTLQSARDAVTLKIPANMDISKLKIGDQVKANYLQELAVAIEPVAMKKKKK